MRIAPAFPSNECSFWAKLKLSRPRRHVPAVVCAAPGLFSYPLVSPFILETPLSCYYAMALFSKRLTCHGCGHRSPQPVRGSVGKFHCNHCDADTYLDQVRSPNPKQSPFKGTDLQNLYRMEKLQTLQ